MFSFTLVYLSAPFSLQCNPNLQVFNVFIDNIDERLPRIALFSTRAIRAGEELTFDYKMQIDPVDTESTKMDSSFSLAGLPSSPKKRIRVECRCGSSSCRKYLFWPRTAGNAESYCKSVKVTWKCKIMWKIVKLLNELLFLLMNDEMYLHVCICECDSVSWHENIIYGFLPQHKELLGFGELNTWLVFVHRFPS